MGANSVFGSAWKGFKPAAIFLVLAALLLFSIFLLGNWKSGFFSVNPTGSPYKIGAVLPLTGNAAVWGEQSREGIDLAVDEINGSGGINGKPLEIVYEDDLSKTSEAVTALQKLVVVDGISIVIGSVNSPETLAMAPIAEEKKVIIMAPGSSSPKLTTAGDYIFRDRVSSEVESLKLAELAFNTLKIRKIALLYRDDDYGHGVAETFRQHFEKFGGTIVQSEAFTPGTTDFKTSLLKIKSNSSEALLIASEPKEAGLAVKQMKELEYNTKILIHSGTKGSEIYAIAGDASNGIIALDTFDKTRKETLDYANKYKQKYGKEAELFSALAYDAAKILAELVKTCGNNTDCIKTDLYQLKDYPGASGALTFDGNGDVMQPFIAEVFQNREFVKYGDKS